MGRSGFLPRLGACLAALSLGATSAFASPAAIRQVLGNVAPVTVPPSGMTFTYGGASDNTAQTTYTFASQAVGTASANRVILVAIGTEETSNTSISSVTIGGVSAIKDVGESAASLHQLEIWSAVVPTGTSITISFTLSGAGARAGIGWASILGSTQTTHSAIADANTKSITATSVTSGSLSIPTNGFAFVATRIQNAAGVPVTWTQSSGTGLKQTDSNMGVNLSMGTYASSFTTSGASTFTAANSSGTSLGMRIAGVSWAP